MGASAQNLGTTSMHRLQGGGVTMTFTDDTSSPNSIAPPLGAKAHVVFACGHSPTPDPTTSYPSDKNGTLCSTTEKGFIGSDVVLSKSPPAPPALSPPPPPAPPDCTASGLANLAGYPCSLRLGPHIEMQYWLKTVQGNSVLDSNFGNGTNHLKARIECKTCRGWLGIGFPTTPGRMVGAKAIIASNGRVRGYHLKGKSTGAVQEMPESEQKLRDTSVETTAAGVSFKFTVSLGQMGVPTVDVINGTASTDVVANMIYAFGSAPFLGYHAHRGATTVKLHVRQEQADVNDGAAALGTADASAGAGASAVVIVIACLAGVVVGGAVAVGAIRWRPIIGGYRPTDSSDLPEGKKFVVGKQASDPFAKPKETRSRFAFHFTAKKARQPTLGYEAAPTMQQSAGSKANGGQGKQAQVAVDDNEIAQL